MVMFMNVLNGSQWQKNESIQKKIKKEEGKKKYITAWGGNRGKETKKTKQMQITSHDWTQLLQRQDGLVNN